MTARRHGFEGGKDMRAVRQHGMPKLAKLALCSRRQVDGDAQDPKPEAAVAAAHETQPAGHLEKAWQCKHPA